MRYDAVPVRAYGIQGRAIRRSYELSGPDKLRDPLEVAVSRDQYEVVFEHQCCDPEVIVGNRCAGPPELNENSRIMFRCLPAGQEHANGGLGEQSVQQTLIAALLRTT